MCVGVNACVCECVWMDVCVCGCIFYSYDSILVDIHIMC